MFVSLRHPQTPWLASLYSAGRATARLFSAFNRKASTFGFPAAHATRVTRPRPLGPGGHRLQPDYCAPIAFPKAGGQRHDPRPVRECRADLGCHSPPGRVVYPAGSARRGRLDRRLAAGGRLGGGWGAAGGWQGGGGDLRRLWGWTELLPDLLCDPLAQLRKDRVADAHHGLPQQFRVNKAGSAPSDSHAVGSPLSQVLCGTTVWQPVERSSMFVPADSLFFLIVGKGRSRARAGASTASRAGHGLRACAG